MKTTSKKLSLIKYMKFLETIEKKRIFGVILTDEEFKIIKMIAKDNLFLSDISTYGNETKTQKKGCLGRC